MKFTRATHQREAIQQAFTEAGVALTPQEVLSLAKKTAPSIGIATIYRNINALLAQGWLEEVMLPGEASRYEVAGKKHHHHFHCRRCERLYEVHSCPGNLKNLVPRGFRLEEHHLVLYGRCAECRNG